MMKEKRKLRDKMALSMIAEGDTLEVKQDRVLFDMKEIKNKDVSNLQKRCGPHFDMIEANERNKFVN